MRLQERDIKKFQRLWLARFSEELTLDDARSKLALLVQQVQLVYRPITSKQLAANAAVYNEHVDPCEY